MNFIYFILGVLFSDSILAWQADPMVINLAETGLPVRNLDFPAVTGRGFLNKVDTESRKSIRARGWKRRFQFFFSKIYQ